MALNVRSALLDDADVIAALHIRSWQHAYRGLLPDTFLAALDVDGRRALWRDVLSDGSRLTLVLLLGHELIGFVSLAPSRDEDAHETTGEITSIYLDPDHVGAGHGRRLMQAGIDEARRRGYLGLTLWVLASNQRARGFYEHMSFREDGQTKTEVRSGGVLLREVRYALKLER